VEVSKKYKLHTDPTHRIWNATISDGKHGLPITCVDKCEADVQLHAPLARIGERVAVTNLTMNRRHDGSASSSDLREAICCSSLRRFEPSAISAWSWSCRLAKGEGLDATSS